MGVTRSPARPALLREMSVASLAAQFLYVRPRGARLEAELALGSDAPARTGQACAVMLSAEIAGVDRTDNDPHRSLAEAAARGERRAAEALLRALLPRMRNLVRYFVRGDAEVD